LIVVSMAMIIAVRWLLLPRVSTGTYSMHSNFYLRKWIMGLATEVTLETLSSLFATVYMGHWYRMMGAKIGKGTEVSTNLAGRYDLVDIGAGNFIGDETVFGDEEMHRGWMTLHKVKTGDRVFFGNDSVIAGGSVIESDALIGVKSKMPEGNLQVKTGETWFGSPPIVIPSRQKMEFQYTGPISRRHGSRCSAISSRPRIPLCRRRCSSRWRSSPLTSSLSRWTKSSGDWRWFTS
jgi:non-ribosomal peptide synthetase-like protein